MTAKSKDSEGRYVLTMRLYPEPWQADILNKRFSIMEHLQNSLIAFELRKLRNLQHTRAWRELENRIGETDKKERKKLYLERQSMLRSAQFSEFDFINDITPMQKHFQYHIAAQVAHKTASDVWRAFDKMLYGTGNHVSFKRRGTLESVGTKKSSMLLKDGRFVWAGGQVLTAEGKKKVLSTLSIRMQKVETDYEVQAFYGVPATYRILRKWMGNHYKWYVQITFKGAVPMKDRPIGTSRVGIDIGTSSIAIVSESAVKLLELAPNIVPTERKKAIIMRKMDRSRRAMNPDNYNENGTIKRGVKLTHNESGRYLKLKGQFKELSRKEAAQRKYQHTVLANDILALGIEVYVEAMNFAGLQRRSKNTEISEKTGRYKRKKRFGKSLARRAPAELISIIDQKLMNLGYYGINKVNTFEYKASQFDHTTGEYRKKTLSERAAMLGNGDVLQRDLYSAWLIMNTDWTLTHPDIERCENTYEGFKILHDREIERIRNLDQRLTSFGI